MVACRSAGHGDGEAAHVAAEGSVVARKATPSQVSSAVGKTSGSRQGWVSRLLFVHL